MVTETLLGELGSSSSSHKETDSGDEDLNFLDADSGASDRGGPSASRRRDSWLEDNPDIAIQSSS